MIDVMEGIIYVILFTILYFEVFLLVSALEQGGKESTSKPTKSGFLPCVSVIVPCWNEEDRVAKTINSLLQLDYPKDKLSIIVVDDGSTDDSAAAIDKFAQHPNVRVFHQQRTGKHGAVNFGIQNSTSELVACLDADCTVEPDALRHMVARFDDPRVMAVTPAIKVREPDTILQHMQRPEYILGIFFRKIFAVLDSQFITPGPFSTYRREVFEKVGLFKKAYNTEDLELGLRMQKAKLFVDNEPKAVVHTSVPGSFPKLVKQRVRWAYGFLNNMMIHRSLLFNTGHVSLSFIILPTVIASILGGLYVAISVTLHAADYVFDTALYSLAIQALPGLSFFSFDLFYFPISPSFFIAAALIAITMVLFVFGTRIAKEKILVRDLVYFALYGFLAPIWLTKAVFETVVTRDNTWR